MMQNVTIENQSFKLSLEFVFHSFPHNLPKMFGVQQSSCAMTQY